MILDEFKSERMACAYFFVAPALLYGIFTSRLPALKLQLGADDGQIGAMLLGLGIATLCGLLAASLVIDKLGSRKLLWISTCAMFLAITLGTLGQTYSWLFGFCLLTGVAVGFCDVSMNAQGIELEKRHNLLCLSFLHACSSIGGVVGSLSGSLFAGLGISPFWNLAILLGLFLAAMPFSLKKMFPAAKPAKASAPSWRHLGSFVWLCGILSLLCHVAEGSAGEWGSILLHSVKGASQQEAALVFAAFTGAMVGTRLAADRLRYLVGDFRLFFWGSILGAAGMALVLLSPWPAVCLLGYAVMGAGLAPIVPILFSRAGQQPGVTPGQASGVVSVFSYAGLLLFPPLLGMLGQAWGLVPALWLIVLLCVLMLPGTPAFRKP